MRLELIGPRIRLRLLRETDAEALVAAAADGELWKLPYTTVPSSETIDAYLSAALLGHRIGTACPYVIEIIASGALIGSTRFFNYDVAHRSVSIGYSWLAASWQRTFANTESKYLLLACAFDDMRCIRVQLKTDETNLRSRAAILRLGAVEEGISRCDRVLADGRIGNSACYSIVEHEWPEVKARLEKLLHVGTAS